VTCKSIETETLSVSILALRARIEAHMLLFPLSFDLDHWPLEYARPVAGMYAGRTELHWLIPARVSETAACTPHVAGQHTAERARVVLSDAAAMAYLLLLAPSVFCCKLMGANEGVTSIAGPAAAAAAAATGTEDGTPAVPAEANGGCTA